MAQNLDTVLRRLRTAKLDPSAASYTPATDRAWRGLCRATADWIDASRLNTEGGYESALRGMAALVATLPTPPEITVADLLEIESLGADRLAIEAPNAEEAGE